jgi:phosphoglycerate-specific signal transduction histidine kinase
VAQFQVKVDTDGAIVYVSTRLVRNCNLKLFTQKDKKVLAIECARRDITIAIYLSLEMAKARNTIFREYFIQGVNCQHGVLFDLMSLNV